MRDQPTRRTPGAETHVAVEDSDRPRTAPEGAESSGSVLTGDKRVHVPIAEAAALLGISRWLAYKLARSGELPTNRVGHNLYVPIQVLRRFEHGPAQGGDAA